MLGAERENIRKDALKHAVLVMPCSEYSNRNLYQ